MRYWVKDKIDHIVSYVYTRRMFGHRCEEYLEGCAVCDAWQFHDDCFGDGKPDFTLKAVEE